MDYAICKLPHWVRDYSFDEYLEVARARPPGLGKDPKFQPLLHEIRALFPVDGDTWVKDIDVTIEPGQSNHQGQVRHAHDEWTAVFYVQPACPIGIKVDGQDVLVQPYPGDVVIMAPGVEHWVEPNKSQDIRLSFAMLVEDPDTPSKFMRV